MPRSGVSSKEREPERRPVFMLHAGLDLSRKRLDYCLVDQRGDGVEVGAVPPDGDGLRCFACGVEQRHRPVSCRRRSSR